VGYRGYEHNHVKPLFPFGYGSPIRLSKFANLAVSPESAGANPQITVTFDVTNSGSPRVRGGRCMSRMTTPRSNGRNAN